MTLALVVKHAGKKYDVEVEESSKGSDFKAKLETLTGVPCDRQKILVKGGQVKDDTLISDLKLASGATLMMLGTAGALPTAPPKIDLTPQTVDAPPPDPNGLVNIGNTCYASSTLQAFRALPDVSEALRSYSGTSALTKSVGSLFKDLDNKAVSPVLFMVTLRNAFPQFNERDPQTGGYKQQDAEELWTQLLESFRQANVQSKDKVSLERYFEGMFEVKLTNTELESEAPTEKAESFNKLSCHISNTTNYMRDGLLAGLTEDIEKNSEPLGRDALYKLEKKISRVPKYLTVQMVRFFWRRDTRAKSKILRKVAFPFTLDICDMCTPELKAKLLPARDALREMENEFEDARRIAKRQRYSQLADKKDKIEDQLPLERQKELLEMVKSKVDPVLAQDPSTNPFGVYELQAIVTHRGMSADSGHYISFVKSDRESNEWWCFNDDKVTVVDDNKIEMLAGGGESDSALILLYGTPSLEMSKKK